MADLVVRPPTAPLRGLVPLPGDKSIAHRAFLLAGLATGESRVGIRAPGEDVLRTLEAMRAMGATVAEERGAYRVGGVGLNGLVAPAAPIDCGNSGTTMRLLTGVLAAQRFAATLTGDASLSGRPMARVVGPLRKRGATLAGETTLRAIDEVPIACALAAVASGVTEIADAAELRVKESDRIASLAAGFRAMGSEVTEYEDGFTLTARPLHGAVLDPAHDHRLAMAFAIAATRADRPVTILGAEAAAVSYPNFMETLALVTQEA
jgi:5-enolpyruvylshikimate-3-phosphate synthase